MPALVNLAGSISRKRLVRLFLSCYSRSPVAHRSDVNMSSGELCTKTVSTKAASVPRSRIYSRCVTLRSASVSLLTRPTRARTVLKVRDFQSHSHGLRSEVVRLPDSLLSNADSFFQGLLADKEVLAARSSLSAVPAAPVRPPNIPRPRGSGCKLCKPTLRPRRRN